MPISPRLSGRLYTKVSRIVNNARKFIFFGTYSINVDYGIIGQIIQRRRSEPQLTVVCLIPPPTDYIIWDFSLRRQFMNAYNLPHTAGPELSEAIARDPTPAFNILNNIWSLAQSRRYRTLPYRIVLDHIRTIGELYRNGIIVLLEPNTHAKFVVSESDIYEGSGNLTRYGLEVNVEVYNFFSRTRYPRVYEFAWRSYHHFLLDYISRFVEWKNGANYFQNAQQLGKIVVNIGLSLEVRFNPKISSEKINKILDNRNKLTSVRSNLWMLSGHLELLKVDFLLSLALGVMNDAIGQIFVWREKEIERNIVDSLHKSLEISKILLTNAKELISKFDELKKFMTDYELENQEKIFKTAYHFNEYLKELSS